MRAEPDQSGRFRHQGQEFVVVNLTGRSAGSSRGDDVAGTAPGDGWARADVRVSAVRQTMVQQVVFIYA